MARKYIKNHLKYGLLENNTIERLYYDEEKKEQRWIEQEDDGSFSLLHDVPQFDKAGKLCSIALCKHKIVRESNNIHFLKKLQEKYNEKAKEIRESNVK